MIKFRDQFDVKLDYSDVLIVPQFSDISSRKEVELDYTPVIASNMDGVGTFSMAKTLSRYGAYTAIVKYYDADQWSSFIKESTQECLSRCFISLGISDTDFSTAKAIANKIRMGTDGVVEPAFCVDVANGYMDAFYKRVAELRALYPNSLIMAGAIVTPEAVGKLEEAGADWIRVGIGNGAVCTTRIKTGVGYPQFSAVHECVQAATTSTIIADGGIQNPGDMCKALGIGAGYVMIGSMFAGHKEGEMPIHHDDETGQPYVMFYGMSSATSQTKHSGGVPRYKTSEGRTVSIPYKGEVAIAVEDLLGGLRSCCAYVGARNVSELYAKTQFIRVNNQYNKLLEHHTISN